MGCSVPEPEKSMSNRMTHQETHSLPFDDLIPGVRILVVDDDEIVRDWLVGVLRLAGYSAEAAADGEEALAIFGRAEFGLVLTDLTMPRLGGIGLIRALRARGSRIPVVIVSASLDDDDGLPAEIRNEVAGELPKPAHYSEILAAVAHALRTWPSAEPGRIRIADVFPHLDMRITPIA
jgi:two-component system, OmpR family, response regulator